MRRYLITGASGFIGSHFVERQAAESELPVEIHAIVRAKTDGANAGPLVTFHVYDGTLRSLCEIVETVQPDVVIHLASYFVAEHQPSDIDLIVDANIVFGTYLLEAMKTLAHPRIINIGTSWQHASGDAYDPVCLYASSKQAFEDILRFYINAHSFRCITLKLFDSYGPADRRRKLIPSLISACAGDLQLKLSAGGQQIDLVYVEDVVDALLVACERIFATTSDYECFAICSGRAVTLKELVQIFEKATGLKPDIDWGARPYRAREVMIPWHGGEVLPHWQATVPLEIGFARCVAALEHV